MYSTVPVLAIQAKVSHKRVHDVPYIDGTVDVYSKLCAVFFLAALPGSNGPKASCLKQQDYFLGLISVLAIVWL